MRYKGQGSRPSEDIERFRALPNTTVLDESPRMLLVASSGPELKALINSMPDWVMSPEQTLKLPDPRPKILRATGKGKTGK